MNHKKQYGRLIAMIAISFMAMYALMYAMVNIFANVYLNPNQFYMAGLMTASMIIIEVFLMWSMYQNKKLNILIVAFSTLVLILFWVFVRGQVLVGDKQFLKSMIPHHAGAILMCEQARIEDSEILDLCESIKESQQAEIDQMKAILIKLSK